MFPQVHNNKKNQKQEEENRKEARAEEDPSLIQPVGNNGMEDLLNIDKSEDDLFLSVNGKAESFADLLPGRKNKSGNDSLMEDEKSDAGGNKNISAAGKKLPKKEDQKKFKKISEEKDPEKIIEIVPDDALKEIVEAVEDSNSELTKSGKAAASSKANKRKTQSRKRQAEELPEISIDGMDGINERERLNKEMKPVKGFDFKPVRLKDREPVGNGRKFLTGLAWYSGKTLGRLMGLIGNAVYWTTVYPATKAVKWIAKIKDKKRVKPEQFQKTRTHDQIPGWDGKKFRNKPLSKDEYKGKDGIDLDFRRIPGVWAKRIAAEAQDEHGEPLDPIISVFVQQPKVKTDRTSVRGGIGHTFLGVEFSRFSLISNRYERYMVRYGLFETGFSKKTQMVGFYKNATTPAQLMNDEQYPYDIGRSYPAKADQVNAIFKATETYADKGYNYFTRNCTTFVKEMVVDTAHIREAESILQPEEMKFGNVENFGLFAAITGSPNAQLGMEHFFQELGAQDDLIYERMGNKRGTKEDYDRYKESLKAGSSLKKFGPSPNSAAENMRRFTNYDPDRGLSSGNISIKNDSNDYDTAHGLLTLADACTSYGRKVRQIASQITPPDMLDITRMPNELRDIFTRLESMGLPIENMANMVLAEHAQDEAKHQKKKEKRKNQNNGVDPLENEKTPQKYLYQYKCLNNDLLRTVRIELKKNVGDLNTFLLKYYKNDSRLHHAVLELSAVLQQCMDTIDDIYNDMGVYNSDSATELGDIRQKATNMSYTLQLRGSDQTVMMSPSHYESYIQIYKTPEKAIQSYARYEELQGRKDREEKLSGDEEKELAKLQRMENLADNFDRSHRYMIEKAGYSQQDIDYAFALGRKEKQGGLYGRMTEVNMTSGSIYKAIMLEKIFGGFQQRVQTSLDNGELRPAQATNVPEFAAWLDKDLCECVQKKMNGMLMIVKAAGRALEKPDQKSIIRELIGAIGGSWMPNAFTKKIIKDDDVYNVLSTIAPASCEIVINEPNTKFRKLLDKLITANAMNTGKDSLQKARSQSKQNRAGA